MYGKLGLVNNNRVYMFEGKKNVCRRLLKWTYQQDLETFWGLIWKLFAVFV